MTDAAALAAIHAASFDHPRPWSAAEIAALLATAGSFALTEPGGFLIGRTIADETELLTLAVEPGRRRQGIGGRLLAAFLARAAQDGARRIFLEVAADNEAAIALYTRHGFRRTAVRKGYYRRPDGCRTDALILSRPAGPAPGNS